MSVALLLTQHKGMHSTVWTNWLASLCQLGGPAWTMSIELCDWLCCCGGLICVRVVAVAARVLALVPLHW